ncbi:hypothetical protein Bcep1808_3583 [Burkholderia vietnamiensis G4]|uniref:Uncharacterized protein n=1 Tax=Burkholderia vietnamiensis (strain G4 / LMG 22486) TaxID=269482 RepID=A4JJW7_BURVG|nr:hypothetical protein Bcep1808_3583 [Burkholderia vietnamiensis G4]
MQLMRIELSRCWNNRDPSRPHGAAGIAHSRLWRGSRRRGPTSRRRVGATRRLPRAMQRCGADSGKTRCARRCDVCRSTTHPRKENVLEGRPIEV